MKKLLLTVMLWVVMVGAVFAQTVNINTATKEQLDGLKGIGPVKAQAIVDYRAKNGPFKTVDDLEKVNGIGPGTMKDIRGNLTVTGATTAAKAESKKADAKKAEPAKADAKKAAPAKADAKKAEPAKADTKKAEPAKANAKKSESVKGDAKKTEPVKADAKKVEPTKADAKKDDIKADAKDKK